MKLDLETLKRIKYTFDTHSDHSSSCNGYQSLCKMIEEAENFTEEKKAMIEAVKIVSISQRYDDGRPDRVWNIGDETTDGKIVEFKNDTGYWYALTDTPSEWHKENGMENGWSWIFQLEEPTVKV